jgi:hypothetical protein
LGIDPGCAAAQGKGKAEQYQGALHFPVRDVNENWSPVVEISLLAHFRALHYLANIPAQKRRIVAELPAAVLAERGSEDGFVPASVMAVRRWARK